jgi:ABC-type transport system substrate-binding protein
VNRDELNKAFFGGRGLPLYLNNYGPTWLGWNPDWEKRFADEYGYDSKRAQQLLQEAGYGADKPLTNVMMVLPVDGIPNGADMAEAIAAYWGAIGVKTDLQTLDTNQVATLTRAARFNNHARIRATSSNQWTGTSTYFSGVKPTRSGGIAVPEGDTALASAVGTLDEGKQAEFLRKAGNAWYDAHTDVPLFWLPPTIVANASIVADYVFPGNVSGNWSHLETIRAAR